MELDVSLMEGKPFRSKLSIGSMGKKKGGDAFVKWEMSMVLGYGKPFRRIEIFWVVKFLS